MHLSLVIVFLVTLAGATVAKPASLVSRLASLVRRTQSDCSELADAADQYLNYVVLQSLQYTGAGQIRDQIEFVTGIDLLQSSEVHRVACRIAEATSLSELREAWDELGITYHVARAAAGYGLAFRPMGVTALENYLQFSDPNDPFRPAAEATLELNELAETTDLPSLAPDAVNWWREQMQASYPHKRGRHQKRQSSAICGTANALVDTILGNIFEDNPSHYTEEFKQGILIWSGIDVEDKDRVKEIVCSILTEIHDIQDMIDVFDEHSLLMHPLNTGYRVLVPEMRRMYERMQDVVDRWEESHDPSLESRVVMARLFIRLHEAEEAAGLYDF